MILSLKSSGCVASGRDLATSLIARFTIMGEILSCNRTFFLFHKLQIPLSLLKIDSYEFTCRMDQLYPFFKVSGDINFGLKQTCLPSYLFQSLYNNLPSLSNLPNRRVPGRGVRMLKAGIAKSVLLTKFIVFSKTVSSSKS